MIHIPESIVKAIINQARGELPNEACGLLTGNGDVVKKSYAMINTDNSPEHFSFDPKEQFAVLKESRAKGQKIIANYHSHPETPARPSEEDLRLALDPDIIYIIISLAAVDPDIKAFYIVNGLSSPCGIKVV
jgi:proteasome lid subunit RPN8/RPN11